MGIKELTYNLVNKKYETPEEIRCAFLEFNKNLLIPSLILSKGVLLYRARIIDSIEDIKDSRSLSYVPKKYNNTYKRASSPNNTMFYGISGNSHFDCIEGCLLETCDCFRNSNTQHKHYKVAIGLWETKVDLQLVQIINVDGYNKSESFNNTNEFKDILNDISETKDEILNFWRFINNQFTKKVNNNKEYWISAQFAEWLVNDLNYAGIIYESVQSDNPKLLNNHCVALTTYTADCCLLLKEVLCYEFDYRGQIVELSSPITIKI